MPIIPAIASQECLFTAKSFDVLDYNLHACEMAACSDSDGEQTCAAFSWATPNGGARRHCHICHGVATVSVAPGRGNYEAYVSQSYDLPDCTEAKCCGEDGEDFDLADFCGCHADGRCDAYLADGSSLSWPSFGPGCKPLHVCLSPPECTYGSAFDFCTISEGRAFFGVHRDESSNKRNWSEASGYCQNMAPTHMSPPVSAANWPTGWVLELGTAALATVSSAQQQLAINLAEEQARGFGYSTTDELWLGARQDAMQQYRWKWEGTNELICRANGAQIPGLSNRYIGWAPGEPTAFDLFEPYEDCMQMKTWYFGLFDNDEQWNDNNCDNDEGFVCSADIAWVGNEWPPPSIPPPSIPPPSIPPPSISPPSIPPPSIPPPLQPPPQGTTLPNPLSPPPVAAPEIVPGPVQEIVPGPDKPPSTSPTSPPLTPTSPSPLPSPSPPPLAINPEPSAAAAAVGALSSATGDLVARDARSTAASGLGPVSVASNHAVRALYVATGVVAGTHAAAFAAQQTLGAGRSRLLQRPRTQNMLLRLHVPMCAQVGALVLFAPSGALRDQGLPPAAARAWGAALALFGVALVCFATARVLALPQLRPNSGKVDAAFRSPVPPPPPRGARDALLGRRGVDALWEGRYVDTHGNLFENCLVEGVVYGPVMLCSSLCQSLLAGALGQVAPVAAVTVVLCLQLFEGAYVLKRVPFIDGIRQVCSNLKTLLVVAASIIALVSTSPGGALATLVLKVVSTIVSFSASVLTVLQRVVKFDALKAKVETAIVEKEQREGDSGGGPAARVDMRNPLAVSAGASSGEYGNGSDSDGDALAALLQKNVMMDDKGEHPARNSDETDQLYDGPIDLAKAGRRTRGSSASVHIYNPLIGVEAAAAAGVDAGAGTSADGNADDAVGGGGDEGRNRWRVPAHVALAFGLMRGLLKSTVGAMPDSAALLGGAGPSSVTRDASCSTASGADSTHSAPAAAAHFTHEPSARATMMDIAESLETLSGLVYSGEGEFDSDLAQVAVDWRALQDATRAAVEAVAACAGASSEASVAKAKAALSSLESAVVSACDAVGLQGDVTDVSLPVPSAAHESLEKLRGMIAAARAQLASAGAHDEKRRRAIQERIFSERRHFEAVLTDAKLDLRRVKTMR